LLTQAVGLFVEDRQFVMAVRAPGGPDKNDALIAPRAWVKVRRPSYPIQDEFRGDLPIKRPWIPSTESFPSQRPRVMKLQA